MFRTVRRLTSRVVAGRPTQQEQEGISIPHGTFHDGETNVACAYSAPGGFFHGGEPIYTLKGDSA
jgi:hypothetical protein